MAGGVSDELIMRVTADVQSAIANLKRVQTELDRTRTAGERVNKGAVGSSEMAQARRLFNERIKQQKELIKFQQQLNNLNKQGISSSRTSMSKDLNNMVQGMGKFAATSYLAAQGLRMIGAEMQRGIEFNKMIEVQTNMFTVMLKDGQKAVNLMKELRDVSLSTPLTMKESAESAKQLLAYGFAAESMTANIKMLGTVAAAVNKPLGDIAYVYGTLRTQGRAYSRDLMQFAMRGVPIYEELAKVMGVSVQEIKKLTEEGRVGFAQVEQAFKNMTSAGGLYAGALEAKMDTLEGKTIILGEKWEILMGKITEGLNPVLKALTDIGSAMVDAGSNAITGYEQAQDYKRFQDLYLTGSQRGARDSALMWTARTGQDYSRVGTQLNPDLPSIDQLYTYSTAIGTSMEQVVDVLEHFKEGGDDSLKGIIAYSDSVGMEMNTTAKIMKHFGLITQETGQALANLQRNMGQSTPWRAVTNASDRIGRIGVNVQELAGRVNPSTVSSYTANLQNSTSGNRFQSFFGTGVTNATSARNRSGERQNVINEMMRQFDTTAQAMKDRLADVKNRLANDKLPDATRNFYENMQSELEGNVNAVYTNAIQGIMDMRANNLIKFTEFGEATDWRALLTILEGRLIGSIEDNATKAIDFDRPFVDMTLTRVDEYRDQMQKQFKSIESEYNEYIKYLKESGQAQELINQYEDEKTNLLGNLVSMMERVSDIIKLQDTVGRQLELSALQASNRAITGGYQEKQAELQTKLNNDIFKLQTEHDTLLAEKGLDYLSEEWNLETALHNERIKNLEIEHAQAMQNLKTQQATQGDTSIFKTALDNMVNASASGDVGGFLQNAGMNVLSGSQLGATVTGANPIMQLTLAFTEALQSVQSFSEVLNWANTIIGEVFVVIGPLLEAMFLPLANVLKLLGEVIGEIIAPFLAIANIIHALAYAALIPLMTVVSVLSNAFAAFSDFIVVGIVNPLIDVINAVIKAINTVLGPFGANIRPLKRLATAAEKAAEALEKQNSLDAIGATIDYLNRKLREFADKGIKSAQELWEVGAISTTEYERRIAEANQYVKALEEEKVLQNALDPENAAQTYAMLRSSMVLQEALQADIAINTSQMNDALGEIRTTTDALYGPIAAQSVGIVGLAESLPANIVKAMEESEVLSNSTIATAMNNVAIAINNLASSMHSDAGTTPLSGTGVGTSGGGTVDYLKPYRDAVDAAVKRLNDTPWWNLVDKARYGVEYLNALNAFNAAKKRGYAVGTPNIPFDHLAMVHKGEGIVPSTFMDAIRKGELSLGGPGGSGGGDTYVVNVTVEGNVTSERDLTKAILGEMYRQRRMGVATL